MRVHWTDTALGHLTAIYEYIALDSMASAQAASDDGEVIAALTALGYSTAEARRAVNALDKSPELTLEDKIRQVLLQLGTGG